MSQSLQLAKQEFARARRYDYPLTLAILRIDRLESLADLYGRDSHDLLVRELVRTLQRKARATDLLGRYTESRLLWLLPHTDLAGARTAAERIRAAVEELEILSGTRRIRVTMSAGLCCYLRRNTIFFDSVLLMAEEALERAQRLGGNRIEAVAPPPPASEGAGSAPAIPEGPAGEGAADHGGGPAPEPGAGGGSAPETPGAPGGGAPGGGAPTGDPEGPGGADARG